MRAALDIATKDLKQRIRDRSALLIAIVAPFVLAVLFSLMLGGIDQSFHADWAIVDLDGGEIAVALVEESARLVEEGFEAEFTVLVWPDHEGRSAFLAARWTEAGLDVVEANDILPDPWAPEYLIAGDGHPSALAARMIGQALAEHFEGAADGTR